jgi:hypothetical protein
LSAPIFNVELFLQSRSYTSLSDLRSELRDYLATLKEELVQLINDDYEAFISLSTDLRREGTRLERLKFPLADLKSETLVCTISCVEYVFGFNDHFRRRRNVNWNSLNLTSRKNSRRGLHYEMKRYFSIYVIDDRPLNVARHFSIYS